MLSKSLETHNGQGIIVTGHQRISLPVLNSRSQNYNITYDQFSHTHTHTHNIQKEEKKGLRKLHLSINPFSHQTKGTYTVPMEHHPSRPHFCTHHTFLYSYSSIEERTEDAPLVEVAY